MSSLSKAPSIVDTRSNQPVSYYESVSEGQAKSGGLFVYENYPEAFEPDFFENDLEDMSTSDISYAVMRKYVPEKDVQDADLKKMMEIAHGFEIPLQSIDDNTFVAWLDQGPTASFKDIAARALAQLMEDYCQKHQKKINLLVATSGDTGVAIQDAFGGSKWITVTVIYPDGGVSPIQEKQMRDAPQRFGNVQSFPAEGNFDKQQDRVKTLFSARELDPENPEHVLAFRGKIKKVLNEELTEAQTREVIEMVKEMNISSANSINLYRLVPQQVQYFSAYASLLKQKRIKPGEKINYAVPTGNVGHLMAGLYAMEIGLPVNKFIMGTNQNNIMSNVIGRGVIQHSGFKKTLAPSQDILDPSNLERLLDFARRKVSPEVKIDYIKMKEAIKLIEEKIKKAEKENDKEALTRALSIEIPLELFGVTPVMLNYLRELIWAEDTLNNEEIAAVISETCDDTGGEVELESHGATGKNATDSAIRAGFIKPDEVTVVFETAHPDKFPEAMESAGIHGESARPHYKLDELKKKPLSDFEKAPVVHNVHQLMLGVRTLVERQVA